jgi:hypothetical protein
LSLVADLLILSVFILVGMILILSVSILVGKTCRMGCLFKPALLFYLFFILSYFDFKQCGTYEAFVFDFGLYLVEFLFGVLFN